MTNLIFLGIVSDMHITIIGTGFVGVVSAAVFAKLGNTVTGLDIDENRIKALQKGKVPFYEPDLEKLLVTTQKKGNLSFTTSYEEAIPRADIIMIAVGTPSKKSGEADLRYLMSSIDSITPLFKEKVIIAIKSTVPPGTCDVVEGHIHSILKDKKIKLKKFSVVSLPEFLKEGTAVHDTLHPDRILIGASDPKVIATLKKLHAPLKAPAIVMSPKSAQMSKYTANAYLATRISFINQIADLCEKNGANITEVIKAIGADTRIGEHYWYPGLGYGGSCFPKDVKELASYAKEVGLRDNLLIPIDKLNDERISKLMTRFEERVGGWKKKKVAVLGLAFKPNTDDMREAASTKIVPRLIEEGAIVRAYDPMATESARTWFESAGIKEGDAFQIVSTVNRAVQDADIVCVVVEWDELRHLDLKKISKLLSKKAFFIDMRSQYARDKVESFGVSYIGIGV